MKISPEHQLGMLAFNVSPILSAIRSGYDYAPGSSDLDDEQPINVRMTLGDYRRALWLQLELERMA